MDDPSSESASPVASGRGAAFDPCSWKAEVKVDSKWEQTRLR